MNNDLKQIKTLAQIKYNKVYDIFEVVPSLSFYRMADNIMVSLVIVTNQVGTEHIKATYYRDYLNFRKYTIESLELSEILMPIKAEAKEVLPALPTFDCNVGTIAMINDDRRSVSEYSF